MLSLLLLLACGEPFLDMETDQVCKDAAYAVSALTFDCRDDEELALARFEQFERQFRCLVRDIEVEPIERYYHCPVAIGALTCDDEARIGDDLAQYLDASPACPLILAPSGAR